MAYVTDNRFFRGDRATFKAAGAETADTTHETVDTGEHSTITVNVDVTAASGTTPTMVVIVEGSHDESTWVELGRIGANGYRSGSVGTAPSNFTGAASASGVFPATQFVRTRSDLGGTTPSFTYSVTAEVGS